MTGVGVVILAIFASAVRDHAVPGGVLLAQGEGSQIYRNVYDGWKSWHEHCYGCHGKDAIGTPRAPNLTDPTRKLSRDAFLKIVRTGVPDTPMQGWDKLLDEQKIVHLYMYVRARADKVLPPGRPNEVGPNRKLWAPPRGWIGR